MLYMRSVPTLQFFQFNYREAPGTVNLERNNQPWRRLSAWSSAWLAGICGQGVRVGIFDTGLVNTNLHSHFRNANIRERSNWTWRLNRDSRSDPNPGALDGHGHGTFVTGLIAAAPYSSASPLTLTCPTAGLAPRSELYIFRVFTDTQLSMTSWFLDAFNYAIMKRLHVINLSNGGPDFMDQPFVDKVNELSANGILLVSAIGNDGPVFGSLNNPADLMDVLGVGGVDANGDIATFSSRGATAMEMRDGYGRFKPDVVGWATGIVSSNLHGGCKILSGTSAVSPVVTGSIALLIRWVNETIGEVDAALLEEPLDRPPINPASLKQAIAAGADAVVDSEGRRKFSIFEQGAGLLNLQNSIDIMRRLKPQASLWPSYLDFMECPYFWPYCSQPLYASGLPIVVNGLHKQHTAHDGMGLGLRERSSCSHCSRFVHWRRINGDAVQFPPRFIRTVVTIINSMGVHGRVVDRPVFHPHLNGDGGGALLDIGVTYSRDLWPWTGHLALHIAVRDTPEAAAFRGLAEGWISLKVESDDHVSRSLTDMTVGKAGVIPLLKLFNSSIVTTGGVSSFQTTQTTLSTELKLPLRVPIIPTPKRELRILWDAFHNIRYPAAYVPTDDLTRTLASLDWYVFEALIVACLPLNAYSKCYPHLNRLGDHIHTNFRDLYLYLRDAGYFIEVLQQPFTCFDASKYGKELIISVLIPEEWTNCSPRLQEIVGGSLIFITVIFCVFLREGCQLEATYVSGSPVVTPFMTRPSTLMIVDPEEEFWPEEVSKVQVDVRQKGLSLLVFAGWFNTSVQAALKFYDLNNNIMPSWGGPIEGPCCAIVEHAATSRNHLRPETVCRSFLNRTVEQTCSKIE
ncbi:unnamed protein product [Hydatigera taeniaeformis]|uniref:Peptidase_S8 domain-containing protein n=1 Tax=Hydatigena taeniaeformis TaxID=6205 RepID=A0A158RES1_HYDTA|nr:unnamed protein product [Hydatigera taeniaeformis]